MDARTVTLHGRVGHQGVASAEIAINRQLLPWASPQTHRARGVRNFTIVGVRNVTTGHNSIFRMWEVILEQRVDVCYFFNSLCTLTIQTRRARLRNRGTVGSLVALSRVASNPSGLPPQLRPSGEPRVGSQTPITPRQECQSSSDASGTLSKVSRESTAYSFQPEQCLVRQAGPQGRALGTVTVTPLFQKLC